MTFEEFLEYCSFDFHSYESKGLGSIEIYLNHPSCQWRHIALVDAEVFSKKSEEAKMTAATHFYETLNTNKVI